MDKLSITRLEMINRHWVALRFSGENGAFRSLTTLFGRQRDYNCYWSNSVLGKDGGWVIRLAWLQQHARRFHNLDRALTAAQRQIAQRD